MIKPFYLDLTEKEISDLQEKFGEILKSGTLILGKYTQEFESEFAKYIGTKYAVSLNTCTSALEVLLTIKGAKGKKIAVPTNTNFATVAAVMKAGGTPVFMDMTKEYYVPNLEILKQTVEKHKDISGIVWVHIGGIINPDFMEIVEYCKSKKIFLMEDDAHAHGSKIGGIKAGNLADGGCFSFFPTKVMTTIEGGMITTNSEDEAKLAKSYRNQGKRDGDYGGMHYDLGSSWRISEISAYMGLIMLSKLDQMIDKRQAAINSLIPTLEQHKIDYVDTSHMDKASQYKFIIKFKKGKLEDYKQKFKDEGVILGGAVYDLPCHQHPVFKDLTFDRNDLKTAEEYCPKQICLPITSGITKEDTEILRSSVIKILGNNA